MLSRHSVFTKTARKLKTVQFLELRSVPSVQLRDVPLCRF